MSALIVIGYPKSGNTWLNYLLAYYLNVPYIDLPQEERYLSGNGERPAYKATDPIQGGNAHDFCGGQIDLVCKTHTLPSEISERYPEATDTYGISEDHPTVMIARDPRDVAVSYFHYRFHRAHLIQETWLHRFAPYPVRDLYFRWRYFDQFAIQTAEEWNSFVLNGMDASQVIIRYEDLLASESKQIQSVASTLDLPFSLDVAQQAAQYCSFSKMQKREREEEKGGQAKENERFFRKGTSGQYSEYFTSSTLEQFERRAKRGMEALRYSPETEDLCN
jgi:hypothetical protein